MLRGGKPGPVLNAAPNVDYVQINSSLENAPASDKTPAVRRAIGQVAGAHVYLTGFPAINHDTQPLYNDDLRRGESIAIPFALIVLAFMFATLGGIAVPLLFALVTISTSLGGVWVVAHIFTMATYVTNIVSLIGLAIAIDYSMLVVFRFREELAHDQDVEQALLKTMATAGRATIFSGLTVAVGLALLAFMPLPFIQSMGVGGLLVPVVSVAASATLLPAMLSVLGRRVNSLRIVPRGVLERRAASDRGFWTRLARVIMKRPVVIAVGSGALMLAIAAPALGLKLTGGDNRGVPGGTNATDGLLVLERTLGPGALAPNQIVIDTGHPGGALTPAVQNAERRLVALLRSDRAIDRSSILAPALLPTAAAKRANLLDASNQIAEIRAAGYSDSGTQAAIELVHRIRNRHIPQAGFPGGAEALLTGRIITAAALIMIAAFAGFTAGRFVGLQEFGVGLSAAILLDATVVRALLVPAAMKLLGHWNWYLPDGVRRAMRLAPASEPGAPG